LVRNCGYRSAEILITDPTKEEAEIFQEFMVDNGVEDSIPLVRKMGVLRLFKLMKESISGNFQCPGIYMDRRFHSVFFW
jgi:hypothetical protein